MPKTPRQRGALGICEGCRRRALTQSFARAAAGADFQLCAKCHPAAAGRAGDL